MGANLMLSHPLQCILPHSSKLAIHTLAHPQIHVANKFAAGPYMCCVERERLVPIPHTAVVSADKPPRAKAAAPAAGQYIEQSRTEHSAPRQQHNALNYVPCTLHGAVTPEVVFCRRERAYGTPRTMTNNACMPSGAAAAYQVSLRHYDEHHITQQAAA